MSNDIIQYNGNDDFQDMRRSDIITPRAKLMQFTSPDVKAQKFKAGAFASPLEGRVLIESGTKGKILPLMVWLQWIEWNPKRDCPKKEQIIAQSIDPRSELAKRAEAFEKVMTPKGEKFAVTEYYNFIVAFPEATNSYDDLYIYSFARTAHKIGKLWWNRMAKLRHGTAVAPMWMHAWEISSKAEKSAEGDDYMVPVIGNATKVPEDVWASLNELSKQLKSQKDKLAERATAQEHDEEASAKAAERPANTEI